jgi:pimeloyl-ACP methyl ester carboxylesterase
MSTIALADMGSYTVGGRAVEIVGRPAKNFGFSRGFSADVDPNGRFWANHCYVQYFVPERQRHPFPLVLVHGGGLTGSSWETTPDGRPGWLSFLLRDGYEVHVVDNVERGRAGYFVDGDPWDEEPILRSDQEAWWIYRFGQAKDFNRKVPFPGRQFPIECLDGLARMTVPRRSRVTGLQREALRELVMRLGRCVLIGHSQGGGFVLDAATRCPRNVACCIVLEPHGDLAGLDLSGVGDMRLLALTGDFVERSDVWLDLTDQLKKLCVRWNGAGELAQHLVLPEVGIKGNSHMIMMDRNSDNVAAYVAGWLEKCEIQIAALANASKRAAGNQSPLQARDRT